MDVMASVTNDHYVTERQRLNLLLLLVFSLQLHVWKRKMYRILTS